MTEVLLVTGLASIKFVMVNKVAAWGEGGGGEEEEVHFMFFSSLLWKYPTLGKLF